SMFDSHMRVRDVDFLPRPLAPTNVQGFQQLGKGPHALKSERLVKRAASGCLLRVRGSAERINSRLIGTDQNRRGHGLDCTVGADTLDLREDLVHRGHIKLFSWIDMHETEQLAEES